MDKQPARMMGQQRASNTQKILQFTEGDRAVILQLCLPITQCNSTMNSCRVK